MGNTIPLSARLMAVADVYDALISERVYKPAYSHEQAVEIIRDGRGSHFDPDMVDAFLALSEEFRRIAQQFADAEPARLAQVDRLAADLPMERIELTSREEPLCVAVLRAGGIKRCGCARPGWWSWCGARSAPAWPAVAHRHPHRGCPSPAACRHKRWNWPRP